MIPGLALAALELYAHDLDLEVAHQWITYGGDGGAMRWALLSIGAAAFVDTFATWWAARSDTDAIPFPS